MDQDTAVQAEQEQEQGSQEGNTGQEQAPPWGADFDPARAWQTIQSQRAAEAELKKELAAFRKAQKEAEDAEKSEAQRLAESVESAKSDAAAARRELAVTRAMIKHKLPEDLEEFLTASDPEAIEKQAEKLAERFGISKSADAGSDSGRPKPALKPGQGGPDSPVVDAEAIAAKVLAARAL